MNGCGQIAAENLANGDLPYRVSRRHAGLFAWLKRHPLPVRAHFKRSLVLTYALPRRVLEPMLPPGLVLDTHEDLGFVAIAMVQTERLRPFFFPAALGQNFFLAGYRIFVRFKTKSGRTLRGLRILRSYTDRKLMVFAGNRLTHYNYQLAKVRVLESPRQLEVDVETPGGESDLRVCAVLGGAPSTLPEHSPFEDVRVARRFAGPLPYTFDYEKPTHSIVMIQGVRREWRPKPAKVDVTKNTFFDAAVFQDCVPILANAFLVENVDYLWRRGVCERLPD